MSFNLIFFFKNIFSRPLLLYDHVWLNSCATNYLIIWAKFITNYSRKCKNNAYMGHKIFLQLNKIHFIACLRQWFNSYSIFTKTQHRNFYKLLIYLTHKSDGCKILLPLLKSCISLYFSKICNCMVTWLSLLSSINS